MPRLALATFAVLLLAAAVSCAPVALDAAKQAPVNAGPAPIHIDIGQTKTFTIERGVITTFAVDLSLLTNVTYFESFVQSTTSAQCTFTYKVNNAGPYTVSFPGVIALSSLYAWNFTTPNNNTVVFNESMGLCGASFTVRMSPLVQLVPKAGLQAANVQLLVGGRLRLALGSAGESLAPFAINITTPYTSIYGISLYNPLATCQPQQVGTGLIASCVLDVNRIPNSPYGGSGQNITGPWTLDLYVSSPYGVNPFLFVNISYIPETPIDLELGSALSLNLNPAISYIFNVPITRAASHNFTVVGTGNSYNSYVYSAANFAIVGSGNICGTSSFYSYNHSVSVILPPQRPATIWTLVFALTATTYPSFPVNITYALAN